MNNQKGYTFVDFLIQLIFVVLFVIILVWLFPTKDYLKNNFNETLFYEKDSDVSDSTFVNNINNMMEASKSYFGYNVSLPEALGEEVTITLQELANEHVIIMPKDKNGKTCSGDSAATITKTTFGYSIKVTLTCGNQTDYIIRSVGCDPFCENDCNTKCKLEYQYVKKTNGYWTNWSNFSDWSTKKVTASDKVKVETKVVDTKTCPSGYTLNNSKTKCIKNVTTQVMSNPTTTLSCPSGYTLNGDKCYKKATTTTNEKPLEVLKCPLGYTLNNEKTQCVKHTSTTNTTQANESITCPSGYTLNGNKCYKTITTSTISDYSYSCPSGYTLNGTTCTDTISIASSKRTYYGCNSGYTYISSNKTCKSVRFTSGGSSSGSCSITYETNCSNGCKVVQKETCIVAANSWDSYSCPDGYSLSSNKQSCVMTVTTPATQSSKVSCPNGYDLNGSKCTKTDVVNPTISYSCKNGALQGDKCIISSTTTDVKEVTKTYSCNTGSTLINNTCIKTTTTDDVINATKTNTCSVGTLTNNTCVVNNNSTETTNYSIVKVTYYRYSTKKYVEGSTTYKWSTSREDKTLLNSGYSLTGKTRSNCS